MAPLNLTIDLASQRFVYPGDLGIGVRQIELTKGNTYDVTLSYFSGSRGLSGFSASGLCWNVSRPDRQNTPLISLSGIAGNSFPLFVASPVLDYAIYAEQAAVLGSYVSFSGGGAFYNLAPLSTLITNNPSLSPQGEYYPLNDNPAGYVSSGSLAGESGQFASLAALQATGNALNAQILALDVESGSFYPKSNPSGYVASGNLRTFTYPLPIGANSYFVPFSPAFQNVPTVAYALDVPPTGYTYTLATSGITPSGFGVFLSSTINASGYALSVIARG